MPERPALEAYLDRVWYGAASGYALRPLAWVFGALVGVRRALYAAGLLRSERIACPVVVVGNLSVGGTGKTPLTAYLAARLAAAGRRPGIATRGHGSASTATRLVRADSTAAEVGDEPLLLSRHSGVPVCVGARRAQAARQLVAAGCDIVLCDDGLQHLALARDLQIVVIDGTRGLGNGRLLPAGPLREPAERLAAADFLVINGPLTAALALPAGALTMRLVGDRAVAVAGGGDRALASFRGQRVHAVAGIGNPQRFFASLRAAGLQPIEHRWPDHHAYRPADLKFGDALPVLMTEKDAVKCQAFAQPQHWYVPVVASFDATEEARLLECLLALPRRGDRTL